jgi:transcriptional regulator with XRE-family HTH domain
VAVHLSTGADPSGPFQIGVRLREERQKNGLTVRELARRIEVSPSLISQIERDIVNPSVATLYAIVNELGLSMNDVFGDNREAGSQAGDAVSNSPAVAADQRKVINLGAGVRWERLTATDDSLVEFLYVVYDAGGSSCAEDTLVRHAGKEYGYVLGGRLGVRIGFAEYELEAGMSISFNSSSPHRLWAIGDEPATAVWVVVGRQSDSRHPRG